MANEPGDLALQMQFELDADETAVMELKLGQYIKGDKGDIGADGPAGPEGTLTPEDMALINTATAQAQASATQAQGSANAAAQSATTSSTQATNSANSAQSAQQFANAAAASATNAAGSSTAAGQQAANAAASATQAATQATNATNAAGSASSYAGQAQGYAKDSEASAGQSAQSASSASSSASGAQSSAQAAAASATAAAGSAQQAADWAGSIDPASFIKKAGDVMTGNLQFTTGKQVMMLKADGTAGPRLAFDAAGGVHGNGIGFINAAGTAWNFQMGDGGACTFLGEVRTLNANAWRIKQGNYGVFMRNDGATMNFMQTAPGDVDGNWNAFRPLSWSLANGNVAIDGTGAGTSFGGTLTVNGTGNNTFLGDVWINNSRALNLNSSTGHATLRCDYNVNNGAGGTGPGLCFVNNGNTAYNFQMADNGNYFFRGYNWDTFRTVANNGDYNGYSADYAAGFIKMARYDYGPYIDFARVRSEDFRWRISYENTSDRLQFTRNGNQNIQFNTDSNIYCSGRGWVWNEIDAAKNSATNAQNTANNKVDKASGNNLAMGWTGSVFNFIVDGQQNATLIGVAVSDKLLKTSIQDVEGGPGFRDSTALIESLAFVAFDYTPDVLNGEHRPIGVIAQDCYAGFQAGDDPTYYVDERLLLFDALHAVKQLSARVATLEAKLASLQS